MEIEAISQQLANLSQALIAVSPAIFIFSVTLLGSAIEQAENEEKAARENVKATIKKEIDEIEQALGAARKSGDTTELTTQLDDLRAKSKESEKEINKIKNKYKRINLLNTVVFPCSGFILAILIVSIIGATGNIILKKSLLIIQIVLIISGLAKLYLGLQLVQLISSNKKESEYFSKLKEGIKLALKEHYSENKEVAELEFVDKVFPLNVMPTMELEIPFKVRLTKGTTLRDAYVWFFISDGFELINPSESSAWRQSAKYDVPNIRTVKVKIGTLSIGPAIPGAIKVKTPSDSGKYLIRYSIRAEGYWGVATDLSVLVG